ncbi:MAG TPA: hypothetical protein DCG57_11195 [Candidatus Riflebacteria bacterium]|nr:hypothetical protein [Candidatus Riflebacteria bacterium]
MGLLAKTVTKGFRACYFRNQPVHQFYSHLQAVLKEISPDGELKHLFARPSFPGNSGANAQEVEWETELAGEANKFHDLPEAKQSEMAGLLASYIQKIKTYAEAKQGKTGVEKDYSDYLKAVAVSPDASQIFVLSGKPVLVHWGYFSEDGRFAGQVKYAGWDEFIAEIQRKAPPKEEEPAVAPSAATSAAAAAAAATLFKNDEPAAAKEPPLVKAEEAVMPAKTKKRTDAKAKDVNKDEKKPAAPLEEDDLNRSKPLMACGLGAYEWVKWLAIVLAIIILLLLFLPKRQSGSPGIGQMGGLGGMMMGGGGGGSGGGNGGGQGGACPHCGHTQSKTAPAGSSQPVGSSQPTQPTPAAQPAGSNPQAQQQPAQTTSQPAANSQQAQPAPVVQPVDSNPQAQPQTTQPTSQPGESAPTDSGNP